MARAISKSSNTDSSLRDDAHFRRVAVQIATQLPEDPEAALIVLALAKELVEKFLRTPPPPDGEDRQVMTIVR